MKKRIKTSIKIILVLVIIILGIVAFYGYNLSSVSNEKNNEIVEFKINKGDTVEVILNNLKDNNIIKSILFTKIYLKLNKLSNLQAGTYNLDNSNTTNEIIDKLLKGKVVNKDEIKITFPEGKNIRGIAKIISDNTNNNEDDVFDLLKDEEYIDSIITKYWFVKEDIKNKDIYYPLEGYLAMNTYIFKDKDVTVKEIFTKMLDQMDIMLTKYKKDIDKLDFSIHQLLTFASIVQSEGIDLKSMNTIAGVFYNRLEKNIPFQSCVTACYGTKEDECIPKNVATLDLNPYNTYPSSMAGKLPIGPVSSFGEDALKAAIFPEETKNLFFISDINNNLYFSETDQQHVKKKAELEKAGIFFR